MDRKVFLKNALGCLGCAILPTISAAKPTAADQPAQTPAMDPAALREWLSQFVAKQEGHMNREALVTLLEERGRACCKALTFRQDLIRDSKGSVDKLVELMGKIVGPENCTRQGDQITLVYPVKKCVCGWSPERGTPKADDPYCECSKANNQSLFETVSGKPVKVQVAESQRRNGKPCRFLIQLA